MLVRDGKSLLFPELSRFLWLSTVLILLSSYLLSGSFVPSLAVPLVASGLRPCVRFWFPRRVMTIWRLAYTIPVRGIALARVKYKES